MKLEVGRALVLEIKYSKDRENRKAQLLEVLQHGTPCLCGAHEYSKNTQEEAQ